MFTHLEAKWEEPGPRPFDSRPRAIYPRHHVRLPRGRVVRSLGRAMRTYAGESVDDVRAVMDAAALAGRGCSASRRLNGRDGIRRGAPGATRALILYHPVPLTPLRNLGSDCEGSRGIESEWGTALWRADGRGRAAAVLRARRASCLYAARCRDDDAGKAYARPRTALPTVRVPTLIMHYQTIRASRRGRALRGGDIPGARYIECRASRLTPRSASVAGSPPRSRSS